ncbi:MAG: hypothetical protein LBN11_04580, partial [Tannerella sp.]|nr:hypothetical protein [Tannerella sp.]
MKLHHLLLCSVLTVTNIFAQQNEWQDPSVNEVNRAPMHTNYFAYENRKTDFAGNRESSANYLSLNGL